MQAAGEQQKGEHAVEKEIRQVGLAERFAEPAHDVQMQHMIAGDDQKGNDQRAEQHADSRRQLDPEIVDAADQNGKAEYDGELIGRLHAKLPTPMPINPLGRPRGAQIGKPNRQI